MSALAALPLLVVLAAGPAAAGNQSDSARRVILTGESGAAILIGGLSEPPPVYANDGFTQAVTTVSDGLWEVKIRCTLDALGCRDPFPPSGKARKEGLEAWLGEKRPAGRRRKRDPIETLAAALTERCGTACEAVGSIIGWVAANIEYTTDQDAPTDALEVLARHRGYCVGRANLAVAMLRAVDIPCRTARGILFNDDGTFFLHRWIEVYYPSRGWVFSDPGSSINFADHRHVLLSNPEALDPPEAERLAGLAARRVDAFDRLSPEDVVGSGEVTLRERRGLKVQHHAAVTGRLGGSRSAECKVVLGGGGLSREHDVDGSGGFFFVGLSPGRYSLRVQCGDRLVAHRRFSLAQAELVRYTFNTDTVESRE